LLAGVGRAQLAVLEDRVAARRANFEFYRNALAEEPGIEFMPEAPYGRCNRWLTCILIDPEEFGATREDVRLCLEAEDIACRPIWKRMHLQPVCRDARSVGGEVSERLFELGLCLPSGSALTISQLERVVSIIRSVPGRKRSRMSVTTPQPVG